MAFTLEDGTGIEGANAYATPTQVTDYLTDRGRQDENGWSSADEAAQNAAIIQATDFMEKRFAGLWRGSRAGAVQRLSWPRSGVVTSDGVEVSDSSLPGRLVEATAEYAVRAISATLYADPERAATGSSGVVTEKFTKVGEIEERTKYSDGATQGAAPVVSTVPSYPGADLLVQPLLTRSLSTAGVGFGRLARL